MRFSRAAAWGTASATVVIAVSAGALLAARPVPSSGLGPGSIVWPLPFAAMAVVGALVASRHPRNATGWLFLATGFLMVSNAFAQAYVPSARAHYPPAAHLMAWLTFWTWAPAAGLIGVILTVFPSGRPPSPRWRWAVWASYAYLVLIPVSAIFTWGASTRQLIEAQSSDVVVLGSGLVTPLLLSVQVLLPLGFAALVVRFVRSRGVERQQLKWFVYGTSFVALSILISLFLILVRDVDPIKNPLAAGSVLIGMTAIPVTAGIAILRYRLYDIDRIISRTLAYAIVTALLGGLFALVVIFPTAVLGSGGTKTPGWLVALATLAVFGLFRPVLRRVRSVVDRRFNRSRYDAERTIDAFSARLREEIDLDTLRSELQGVVDRTMQPASVSLWLREGDR
jgi:hypothetical protein